MKEYRKVNEEELEEMKSFLRKEAKLNPYFIKMEHMYEEDEMSEIAEAYIDKVLRNPDSVKFVKIFNKRIVSLFVISNGNHLDLAVVATGMQEKLIKERFSDIFKYIKSQDEALCTTTIPVGMLRFYEAVGFKKTIDNIYLKNEIPVYHMYKEV